MHAMLLAAGRGSRLAPLTDTLPKPLAPLNGKALIDYHLDALCAAGVTHVVINIAWLAESIVEHIADGSRRGLGVVFSREPEGALETGGGIVQALPWLGDAPFWVVNADVFTDFDFNWRTETLAPYDDARLLLVENPEHNLDGDFRLDEAHCRLKSDARGRSVTYAGIGLFRPQFFAQREPGRAPLAPWLFESAEAGRLTGALHSGIWDDIGTVRRLRTRERMLKLAGKRIEIE